MATTAAAIAPGSLVPKAIGKRISGEFDKLGKFLEETKELATSPINSLKISSDQRTALRVRLGSELNVHDGKSALKLDAAQIKKGLSQDKTLSKEEKAFLNALENVCKSVGEIEELLVKGKTSYASAFKLKKVDQLVRSCLAISERPCFGVDTNFALQYIDKLEKLKEKLPEVSAALSKNAQRIQTAKSKSLASPFREATNEGASGADGLPNRPTPNQLATQNN